MSTNQEPLSNRLCLWGQGTDYEMPIEYASVAMKTFSMLGWNLCFSVSPVPVLLSGTKQNESVPVSMSRDLRMVTMMLPKLHSRTEKPGFQMENCRGEQSTKAKAERWPGVKKVAGLTTKRIYSWWLSKGIATVIWQLPVYREAVETN